MRITKEQIVAYGVILASFYFAFSKSKKEKIKGGLADFIPDSHFNKKDLEKGIKVEMEHTTDRDIAKEIAKDHLHERADYYDRLEELEKSPIKKRNLK